MDPVKPIDGSLFELDFLKNIDKEKDQEFFKKLKEAVAEVNRLQHVSERSIEEVVRGNLGVHEGMLAMQEASISLKLLMQVRAKVMAAYQEIMRMPV